MAGTAVGSSYCSRREDLQPWLILLSPPPPPQAGHEPHNPSLCSHTLNAEGDLCTTHRCVETLLTSTQQYVLYFCPRKISPEEKWLHPRHHISLPVSFQTTASAGTQQYIGHLQLNARRMVVLYCDSNAQGEITTASISKVSPVIYLALVAFLNVFLKLPMQECFCLRSYTPKWASCWQLVSIDSWCKRPVEILGLSGGETLSVIWGL